MRLVDIVVLAFGMMSVLCAMVSFLGVDFSARNVGIVAAFSFVAALVASVVS